MLTATSLNQKCHVAHLTTMQLLAYKLFLDIDLMEENREVGGKASVDSRLLDEPLALTR